MNINKKWPLLVCLFTMFSVYAQETKEVEETKEIVKFCEYGTSGPALIGRECGFFEKKRATRDAYKKAANNCYIEGSNYCYKLGAVVVGEYGGSVLTNTLNLPITLFFDLVFQPAPGGPPLCRVEACVQASETIISNRKLIKRN